MKSKILLILAAVIIIAGCSTAPAPQPVLDRNARVEIMPGNQLSLEVAAQLGPFQAISGIRGQRLEPTDVIITFRTDRIRERIRPGTEINWITNLPAGLTARVREAERGSNRAVIVIEGVPTVTLNEAMRFNIPAGDLQRIGAFEFISEEAKFEILLGSLNLQEHTASITAPPPNYILLSGSVGVEIQTFDFRINLIETSLTDAILTETPVNWVLNRPAGLSVTVQPAPAGATTLYLTVRGTPQGARNEIVSIAIPGVLLGDVGDFYVPNELIRWDIIGASVNPVVITGSIDTIIVSSDVTINLLGTVFSEDLAPGTIVNNWIVNLPEGLTARVRRVRSGEAIGTITIAGTPREVSTEVLQIAVPDYYVRREITINVISNVDARFAINDNIQTVTVNEIAGGSSNPNWMGSQVGPLNIPGLPSVKDFEGLGIVTVRTTAVQQLGADNQYHWTGQTVNYGMLITEAQRLGAHAIVNVVIDFTDHIERNEVIRELSPDHVWSQSELDRMASGILREVINEHGRFSVEVNHVITRTYIGSALAIRFIDGVDFLEAAIFSPSDY